MAFHQEGFEKKTNEAEEDWSDVEAAITALHADRGDAARWRAELEARFDVDGFLHVLALNTVVLNWDMYGAIAHNYFLYGDPRAAGRLVWIPWDPQRVTEQQLAWSRDGPAAQQQGRRAVAPHSLPVG